ncbi:MAG: hypothetical protein ACOC4M_08205 [Promethearchaeia archaeon]
MSRYWINLLKVQPSKNFFAEAPIYHGKSLPLKREYESKEQLLKDIDGRIGKLKRIRDEWKNVED